MKKLLVIVISLALLTAMMEGCSPSPENESETTASTTQTELSITGEQTTTVSTTVEATVPAVTESYVLNTDQLEHRTDQPDSPVVYMTTDISPEGLIAIYEALERTPTGNVAIKLHTGEGDNSFYLRPDFIEDFVHLVDGTIVECNTAYGGNRSNTALHKQVAEDRGYTAIATVDIMDEDGGFEIPVDGGTHLTTNQVGANFVNYDFFIILSHFKGHQMGGFGGALKNTSIGIASSEGKSLIHTGGESRSGYGPGTPVDIFTESMAEAAKSVSDYLDHGNNILYINVVNNISVDCDCNPYPAQPDMHDIGILASLDPVALDQACVDLIYAAPDGESVIERIESRNGTHILEHAQEIGLGSREYQLVSIDD